MNPADDRATVADLVRGAVDNVLRHVSLEGADVEFAVTWWPKGRAITAVHVVQSDGASLTRTREGLEVATQQIDHVMK